MIKQLNIKVAENQRVMLTLEQLTKLFEQQYLAFYRQFMDSAGRAKPTATLYYISEADIWSFDSNEIGVEIMEFEGHWLENPAHCVQEINAVHYSKLWAAKMMAKLWDREFPLHVKVKKLEAESHICGELLDWLKDTKDYHIAAYHEHTTGCHAEGETWPVCQMSDQILYGISTSTEDLLWEFFGVDRKAFDAETDRMLEEIRADG